jgi:hypothetical protein
MNLHYNALVRRYASKLSVEALGALVVVPLLVVLFDWLRGTNFLTAAVPVPYWTLLLAIVLVVVLVRHFYKSRHLTFRLAGNSRLLPHLATELHRCFEEYGSKIVVYRVMPFEFSEELFTHNELAEANFKKALDQYNEDISTIIVRGKGSEDYWDKTVYGRTGFTKVDHASWRKIDRLYSGGYSTDADRSPDTSQIGFEASINSFGLFLIGQLTSDGLYVQRWICGYDFYNIALTRGAVEFEACLFTMNPDVLKAYAKRIENIFEYAQRQGHYHPLNEKMEAAEREKIFGDIRNMLCPDSSAIKA